MSLDRFEELYERFADGALSPVERTEFLGLLADPSFRARLVDLASFEATLGEELRLADRRSVPAGEREKKPSSRRMHAVGGAPSKRIPGIHLRRAAEKPGDPRMLVGAIAAAFLLAVILILASGPPGEEGRRPSAPVSGKAPPLPLTPPSETPLIPREEEGPRKIAPVPAPTPLHVAKRPNSEIPAPESAPPAPIPPPSPAAPSVRSGPPPRAETQPAREAVSFIARIERIAGEVRLGTEAAEVGRGIPSGQGVFAGAGGYALVQFADGTKLELGSETSVARLSEGVSGKAVQVERGLIGIEAAKQPAGKPLVVVTPFAESTVVGTEFTVWTTASYTRLDVKEGRVKFARPGGATSVMVGGGHFAVAGPGFESAVKPWPSLWKAPSAGLVLWLRADSVTIPAQWPDLSPSGNHGTQPVLASQPTLVANAAGTRPALRFDGKTQHYLLPDGFGDFRAGLSAVVVARPAPGVSLGRFIDLDQGPQCDNIVFGRKDSPDKLGFWVYANNQTRGKVEAPGVVIADQVQSFGAVLALGGRVTLYRNGTPVATGQTSVPVSVPRKPNAIGKSNTSGDPYFKGDLFEILLFNRAVTESERQFVDGYVNAKYFDPTTPPAMNRPVEK